MSSVVSLIQGFIAGGTVSYLSDRVQKECESGSTSVWTSTALQINHLFFLTAETLMGTSVPTEAFVPLVQAVYILTPAVLLLESYKLPLTAADQTQIPTWNHLYKVAASVLLVAAALIGDSLFTVSSVATLAFFSTKQKTDRMFQTLQTAAACGAGLGYLMQIVTYPGLLVIPASISSAMMLYRLFIGRTEENTPVQAEETHTKPCVENPVFDSGDNRFVTSVPPAPIETSVTNVIVPPPASTTYSWQPTAPIKTSVTNVIVPPPTLTTYSWHSTNPRETGVTNVALAQPAPAPITKTKHGTIHQNSPPSTVIEDWVSPLPPPFASQPPIASSNPLGSDSNSSQATNLPPADKTRLGNLFTRRGAFS